MAYLPGRQAGRQEERFSVLFYIEGNSFGSSVFDLFTARPLKQLPGADVSFEGETNTEIAGLTPNNH